MHDSTKVEFVYLCGVYRELRLSHDALYNIYQLSFQLKFSNRKGVPIDFVAHIMLHPRIIIQLLPHPLLETLEQLLMINTEPTFFIL